MKEKRKTRTFHKLLLIFLLAFVAFGGVVGYTEHLVYEQLKPPEDMHTLEELRPHLPPPTDIETVEIEGKIYKLWWVETPAVGEWTLPSGRPLYVFDADEKLVIWATETGEGGRIDTYAYADRILDNS